MARWAVFDVDGTLLPGSSMEKLFIRHCAKKGLIPAPNFLRFMLSVTASLMARNAEAPLKSDKMFLKNLPVDCIEAEATDYFKNYIAMRLSHQGKQAVNLRRQQGYKILLMTGSPEFLARHLNPIYQPDELISYILETRGDVFTGQGSNLHPYGIRKKEILLQRKKDLDLCFEESVVFANHHDDAYHMELFGEAVAINPTPKLQTIARKCNWPVEWWS